MQGGLCGEPPSISMAKLELPEAALNMRECFERKKRSEMVSKESSVEVVIRLSGQPLVVLKLEPYRLISVYVGGTSE
jgi:hypothetical protein